MSTPPKRPGVSSHAHSKDLRAASEALRLHMQIRAKVTRMSEMCDRHDQVRSTERELISGLLADLDKQGEVLMVHFEEVGGDVASSIPPPAETQPVVRTAVTATPPARAPAQRPSMKPTVMAQTKMDARGFAVTIRERYAEASNENEREQVIEMLRRGIYKVPGYGADLVLLSLERELRAR